MNQLQPYLDLVQKVLTDGQKKEDRTGTGTLSIFGHQMRFNLEEGFPLLTNKFTSFRLIVSELLWFLSGSTNAKVLQEKYNNNIWREWMREDGELGPIYSKQWRAWNGATSSSEEVVVDQIKQVIEQIKSNPDSRRLIVSAWNVAQIDEMRLPPCHILFQFYVNPLRSGEHKRRLSCQLYQRSADLFLGVPFNIASYALLTHLIARACDLEVGEFVHTIGDAHVYLNHITQCKDMLSRAWYPSPQIGLNPMIKDIDSWTLRDIQLINYLNSGKIEAPVAV